MQAGNSLANNPDIEKARFKVKALEQQIRDLEETLNRVGTEVKIETKTISQKDLENSVKDAKEQLRNRAIGSLQLKGKVKVLRVEVFAQPQVLNLRKGKNHGMQV